MYKTFRERLKLALYLEICVGRFHEKLVFGLPLPPYKNATYVTYNVKSSDLALISWYYVGDFNEIEGGPFEVK